MTQPMDAPTEEGWWAFEGKFNGRPAKFATNIIAWEPNDEYPYYRFGSDDIDSDMEMLRLNYIGKWTRVYMPWEQQPDTRLICQECNDYLEHPSYCEVCFGTMKQAALEGRWQPATVPDTVREVAVAAIKYMLASEDADDDLRLPTKFRNKMKAALTWLDQQPQEGGDDNGT